MCLAPLPVVVVVVVDAVVREVVIDGVAAVVPVSPDTIRILKNYEIYFFHK